jgi:chemotaxis protein methyltransferase CheR
MTAHEEIIAPENFAFLQRHVYDESGIVLDSGKQYLLHARLLPLVQEKGLACLDDLCALLRATEATPLHSRVVEAMTTNETYFFREPAHYQALREVLVPELVDSRRATRKLALWSAAASTGQEAYSIAMMLLDMGLGGWNIEILGTDISPRVLKRAETGRYSQLEVNRGLPATSLVRYFRRAGLEWELREDVRRLVRFQAFDLRSRMNAMGPFDVVFCRNVLIYFDDVTRRAILNQIHGSLFRGGKLILGSAETSIPGGGCYVRETVGNTVIYAAS